MSKVLQNSDGSFAPAVSTTFLDTVLAGATSPLSMFTESNEFYNKKDMGVAVTLSLVGGMILGRRYGSKIPGLNSINAG